MSDQKLISPLLDGFLMGDPISDHDGVRCCPAMREENEDKYIVKIISIPSSQRQLDALLLTGAYPDAASAMEYFKEQADGVAKEAEILKNLSSLQGFLPYEGWQIMPIEKNRLGYDVYLLSPYKRSLEKHLKHSTMTHSDAVDLGLKLCEALSICRRAGFMYVALKPSNIFLDREQGYKIGDLGFTPLSAMKYNSMPDKYRSVYTPRELHDDLVTLNPTVDVYGIGMILYRIFNNGVLPFQTKAPETPLDTPQHADPEIAEIILKAIDPNPKDRWQTPIEMGQALAAYLTRNGNNDTPILVPSHVGAVGVDPGEATTEGSADADEIPDQGTVSGEVGQMLAQADELLTMKTPDPVVVPEAPNVEQIHEMVKKEVSPAQDSESTSEADTDSDEDEITLPEKVRTFSLKPLITTLLLTLVIGILGYGGLRFYRDYYLLPIDSITITGSRDSVCVLVDTTVDETLLTVVCTDTYGNSLSAPLIKGSAEFIGLNPASSYKIMLEAEGFHKLSGAEPCTYTTSEQTKISHFSAKTGAEDGSVILSFDLEGRDSQDWVVRYTAEGEEEGTISFTGRTVSIHELTIGKTYTFQLVDPSDALWIVGKTSLEYVPSEIIIAQNLEITDCVDGVLSVHWLTPPDVSVDSWTVRCYSESGYDNTLTTVENQAAFDEILTDKSYTVEVTAAGMSQSARTYISANPTTITHITVDAPKDDYVLTVNWEYAGPAPEGGWLLLYSMDDGENRAVIPCESPSATIDPRVPGVTYHFSIQTASGSTVFHGKTTYECVETDAFSLHDIKASKVSASLCPTPKNENWTYKNIGKNDYTSKYAPGSRVSIVIYSDNRAKYAEDSIEVMFVIRDSNGNVMPELVHTITQQWSVLWNNRSRYCELDIPAIPGIPGKYTVEIYFNQQRLLSKNLTITE